jgi:uncharacterized DUF497 family protein
MTFEFDRARSDINKEKHGINFLQASALWESKVVLIPAKDAAEKRYITIGKIGAALWTAIITYRGPRIRIISVRRSTPRENEIYEKNTR